MILDKLVKICFICIILLSYLIYSNSSLFFVFKDFFLLALVSITSSDIKIS